MLRAAHRNGGVDAGLRVKFTLTLLATILLFPLRLIERVRFANAVEQTQIEQAPIFIVGHWRSGTTHLHNILTKDTRFGFVTTLQAIFPTFCILVERYPLLKKAVARLIPKQRMMDNVKMGLDYPQEEEFSLSCLTTSSHHCNHFPKTIAKSFDEYVLFRVSDSEKKRWKKTYLSVLKKATFMAGGKQLVLKNPYNTARISTLLELFPNAKFVHIYRNPFNIYVSSLHDFVKEAEEMALQECTEEMFSETCFELYEKLMKTYWQSKASIPPGQLCEVAYEDLERDPTAVLRRVYAELNLGETETALSQCAQYLQSIRNYKKNRYSYSETLARKISERWNFAVQRLKYGQPNDIAVNQEKAWTCEMNY